MKPWAIFTDLDGTLLDAGDFSVEPARPLLRRLLAGGVPIIPVTSKTRAELLPLATELGLPGPLVVESGGGILRRTDDGWVGEGLGLGLASLRSAAEVIARRTGCRLEPFVDMEEGAARRASGLSGMALSRARRREFSLPFLADEGSVDLIAATARQIGLAVRRGGRFLHLTAVGGKGSAFLLLRRELAAALGSGLVCVALGDSPLDAELLRHSDMPIIVPRLDGRPDDRLLREVPQAVVAPAPGPRGWAMAVASAWARLRSGGTRHEPPPPREAGATAGEGK